jgi:hypothetical protein
LFEKGVSTKQLITGNQNLKDVTLILDALQSHHFTALRRRDIFTAGVGLEYRPLSFWRMDRIQSGVLLIGDLFKDLDKASFLGRTELLEEPELKDLLDDNSQMLFEMIHVSDLRNAKLFELHSDRFQELAIHVDPRNLVDYLKQRAARPFFVNAENLLADHQSLHKEVFDARLQVVPKQSGVVDEVQKPLVPDEVSVFALDAVAADPSRSQFR